MKSKYATVVVSDKFLYSGIFSYQNSDNTICALVGNLIQAGLIHCSKEVEGIILKKTLPKWVRNGKYNIPCKESNVTSI